MSQDEQLCLVFARILIQAPPWVLIDGTFGSLDDDVLELVIDVFAQRTSGTPASSISAVPVRRISCSRSSLHLVKAPRQRTAHRHSKHPEIANERAIDASRDAQ